MAKKSPIEEAGTGFVLADLKVAAVPTTSIEAAPAEETTAPAPLPLKARSDAAPLKPGVRTITLAQARAHHAAKHLGQV